MRATSRAPTLLRLASVLSLVCSQLLASKCGTEKGSLLIQGYLDAGVARDGGEYAITGGVGAYLGASGSIEISPVQGFDPMDEGNNGILGRGTVTINLIRNCCNKKPG